MLELKSKFLCDLDAYVDEPLKVGSASHGYRLIYPIKNGTVRGPKLNGEILATGGDWFLMRKDGASQLDVRIAVRADDDALIYAHYKGILKVSPDVMSRMEKGEDVAPGEYYFRTIPVFETGSEKYKWLNQIVTLGVGALKYGNEDYSIHIRYKIYEIL